MQSYCHALSHAYFSTIFTRLIIPSILLGAAATIFNGAALLAPDQAVPLTIVALLSTALTTAIGTWIQSSDPSSTAAAHAQMASGYQRIILEIDSELTNEPDERMNGTKFIYRVKDHMSELATGGVTVPLEIWNNVRGALARGEYDFDRVINNLPSFMAIRKNLGTRQNHVPTVKIHTDPEAGQSIIDVQTLQTPEEQTAAVADIPMTVAVDLSGSELRLDEEIPRFELRISNPLSNKIAERLLDFNLNRFA